MKKVLWNDDFKLSVLEGLPYVVAPEAQEITLPHCVKESACAYYKHFGLTPDQRGKRLFLQFDGALQSAIVYLNGSLVSSHINATAGFIIEITNHIEQNDRNLLCVCVRNDSANQVSGLNRSVWLLEGDDVFISPFGLRITTPEAFSDRARILCETEVYNGNAKAVTLIAKTTIYNHKGRRVGMKKRRIKVKGESFSLVPSNFRLKRAQLWSPESPFLYRAVTEILPDASNEAIKNGEVLPLDTSESTFAIKDAEFIVGSGFTLNGAKIKLRGTQLPHENGMLCLCENADAEGRKIRLLKDAGFNAARINGCPSPSLVDACDREGVFLLPELLAAWEEGAGLFDFDLSFNNNWQQRVDYTVRRYLNNPSIIAWGIGENPNERNTERGAQIAQTLANYVRSIDSRAVCISAGEVLPSFEEIENLTGERSFNNTEGDTKQKILDYSKECNIFGEKTEQLFQPCDIAGYINLAHRYAQDTVQYPERLIMGVCSSQDIFETWEEAQKSPNILGDFCENGIASANQPLEGEIDITGRRRPKSYYRAIVYGDRRISKIIAHDPDNDGELVQSWNFPRHLGQKITVDVITAGDVVALYQNGRPVGRKLAGKNNKWMATFEVEYQVGRLEAVCFNKGEELARAVLETVGSPKTLRISSGKKSVHGLRGALVYADIEVLDESGRVVTFADREITVEVRGVGRLRALGNSKGVCQEGVDTVAVVQGCAQIIAELDGNAGKLEIVCYCQGLRKTSLSIRVM